ncbi:rhamnogalacturonan endolyase [Salvia divinorum]|uniref:rhamnogalacturonan endolyase n=1 Tax=Salvia divinorum TaxID=28513 RepID=A0ABD1IQ48_SALDI
MVSLWERYRWDLIIWRFALVGHLFFSLTLAQHFGRPVMMEENIEAVLPSNGVHMFKHDQHIVLSNGLVNLTLSVPDGMVITVTYKGSANLLDTKNKEDNRGYWDVVWNKPGGHNIIDMFSCTSYKIVMQSRDQTEISFTSTWEVGSSRVPLNIDKRYVMLRDSPGFYTYTVLERLKEWPAFLIQEGRIVFKLQENTFHYMAMSDERQRVMPTPEDRSNGESLDYPEAVLLQNPTNPQFEGEVDDKYLYSCENKDNKVHGWVSSDLGLGFWMITPSNEFKTGGPLKQDLTSHVGPTLLSMFMSTHYVGEDIAMMLETGEHWKKVLGPVYVYLNSDIEAKTDPSILWNDAKQRMEEEVASWPYNFPLSGDFIKSEERGAVMGQLFVRDRYKHEKALGGASALVGLAPPGPAGSWQLENKGYQFWTEADEKGNFLIKNVIPGTYSLFASVPGTIGDYKHASDITIPPRSNVVVRRVVFDAPRNGPTLWEIGIPDRSAAEFFIPDPNPRFKIHPYPSPVEKFRQYGLWTRYEDYYPHTDLVYTVGQSNYSKDWFFVHSTRDIGGNEYQATTWQIQFDLKDIKHWANYTLQLALASANGAELQVHINNPNSRPQFSTGMIGRDNALARHGIHGLYHLYSIAIAGTLLVDGNNTVFLSQTRNLGPFRELMYDYIRLEGPA